MLSLRSIQHPWSAPRADYNLEKEVTDVLATFNRGTVFHWQVASGGGGFYFIEPSYGASIDPHWGLTLNDIALLIDKANDPAHPYDDYQYIFTLWITRRNRGDDQPAQELEVYFTSKGVNKWRTKLVKDGVSIAGTEKVVSLQSALGSALEIL